MGAGHDHAPRGAGNERKLIIALGLTGTYLVAEVIGGILARSLALLSDAAHMLTDVAALAIALAAIGIGKRPADARRTRNGRRDPSSDEQQGPLQQRDVHVLILTEQE
jgi:cobalt-zinc-cadmium efflux system protein